MLVPTSSEGLFGRIEHGKGMWPPHLRRLEAIASRLESSATPLEKVLRLKGFRHVPDVPKETVV